MGNSEHPPRSAHDLLQQREAFQVVQDYVPVLMWMSGRDAQWEWVSKTWCAFTGRSQEEECGNGWLQCVHADDTERCSSTYAEHFQQAKAFNVEYRMRRHDGMFRWVQNNGAPRFTALGEFSGFIGTCTDITAQKEAEDALRLHSATLARSNAELERFAYIASHDLQEPLRMISNFAELFARRYETKIDEEGKQIISYAVEGANRIRSLIDDLKHYVLVGKHGRRERVAAGHTMDNALQALSDEILQAGASIVTDDLPEIVGDPEEVTLVFRHLIGNALKYRSTAIPVIRVSAVPHGSSWLFAVEDNGIGIDPRYHERIFDVFQRLHSRVDYPGTGIGLAICRKIVEQHNGRMWVDSALGRGSTFRFNLPAA